MNIVPFDDDDPRTEEQRRYDAICDQVAEATRLVRELAAIIPRAGQTQTVIHKTQGLGAAGIVCAAICVLCVLFVAVEFNRQNTDTIKTQAVIDGRLRDLDAWRGVHSNDIAALKAKVQRLEERRP